MPLHFIFERFIAGQLISFHSFTPITLALQVLEITTLCGIKSRDVTLFKLRFRHRPIALQVSHLVWGNVASPAVLLKSLHVDLLLRIDVRQAVEFFLQREEYVLMIIGEIV